MSLPRTHEQCLLAPAEQVLSTAGRELGTDARLVVLEGAASRIGGFDLAAYRERFGPCGVNDRAAAPFASALVTRLRATAMAPPVALAALGRKTGSRQERREAGAYYTDFRLASHIGARVAANLTPSTRVVDLAAGSGVLLVASVLGAGGADRQRANALVRESVCAADVDPQALRACRAALAAVCDDLDAIAAADGRLRRQDSLIGGMRAWRDVTSGFDLVVGNPPWEKVKVSRHEFLLAGGYERHYGDEYALASVDREALQDERVQRAAYAASIEDRYPLARSGELDLFKAFFACSLEVLRPGGSLCLLVPAGLIRSQGTERLRRHLLGSCGKVSITILENRARFFPIDTRFKFLVVEATKGMPCTPIVVSHAIGTEKDVQVTGTAAIERRTLQRIRRDLTVPEVKDGADWKAVVAMHGGCWRIDEPGSPFRAAIVREVDMTRDRERFARAPLPKHIPLVEGRMVGQHRFGVKAYQSGTGRKALWKTLPIGASAVEPQFYYPFSALPPAVAERVLRVRVGFCDVTGQTNERSIIAAPIPSGVVCGNKVPTITFRDDEEGHLSWLFLAIANSLPFDWLARRVLTTSVNYFLLRSIPLPRVEPRTLAAKRLAELARALSVTDAAGSPLNIEQRWQVANWRAEIDAQVLTAWGLSVETFVRMLKDFPLLDRFQPPLRGEECSTVTRDLALSWAARLTGTPDRGWTERAGCARSIGAVAYNPSQHTLEDDDDRPETPRDLLAGDTAG